MSHLSKLKIVAQQQKRLQSKTEHRRAKLLEKLDDQLAMVQALITGELFTRHRRVWQTIAVNKREDLPDAIRSVMEAVKQGELDIQIEDVAEKGTAELRLKGPLKEMKRAG